MTVVTVYIALTAYSSLITGLIFVQCDWSISMLTILASPCAFTMNNRGREACNLFTDHSELSGPW